MSQMIHYRDDMFLLSVGVKALESALSVEADPEFWLDKIVGDIIFVDATARKMAGILARNLHLVDRESYLRLLERIAIDLSDTLEGLREGDSPMIAALAPHMQRISSIAAGLRDLAQDLGESLAGRDEGDGADAAIVSGDEIERLLGAGPG